MTPTSASNDQCETIQLSAIEHRRYLTQLIKTWWEKHRSNYNLDDNVLTEPGDYELILNEKSVAIKCSCNQKINLLLTKGRKHYQLSNFYKHLTRNDQCTVVKRKCATSTFDEENTDDSKTSFSLPIHSSSQHSTRGVSMIKNNQQLQRSNASSSNRLSGEKCLRRNR